MSKINLNLLYSLVFLNQTKDYNITLINDKTNFIINNINKLNYNDFINPFFNIMKLLYNSFIINDEKGKHENRILSINSLKIIIIMYLKTKENILKDFIKDNNYYFLLINILLLKIMYTLFNNKIIIYIDDIEHDQLISSKIYEFIDNTITNENFMYNIKMINDFINKNYDIKGGKNNKNNSLNKNNKLNDFINNNEEFQKRIYFFIYYLILSMFDDRVYDNIDNYDYLNMSYLDYLINDKIIYFKELYPFSFNINYNMHTFDFDQCEFLKDIRDKYEFNKSLEEIINNKKSLNIKKLKFINNHLNTNFKINKKLDNNFIYINKNKNNTTNIITSSKNINNIYVPNKIIFDYNISFEHGCYFESTIELILTILNIDNNNILQKLKNKISKNKIKKLEKFINILTHANKNKYTITQIYNFLCDYFLIYVE